MPYPIERDTQLHLDIIFEKENSQFTKKALLLQDILLFRILDQRSDEFKIRTLGSFLLEKNLEFYNRYKNTQTNFSNRFANVQRTIQSRVDDLVDLRILDIIGSVPAQKNKEQVPLYKFTPAGDFIAYLTQSKARNSTDRQVDQNTTKSIETKVRDGLLSYLGETDSIFNLFLMRFFEMRFTHGASSHLTDFLIQNVDLGHLSNASDLLDVLLDRSQSLFWALADSTAFLTAFDGLPESEKEVMSLQFKLQIEQFYGTKGNICKEWELARLNHRSDVKNVITLGHCTTCKVIGPVVINLPSYIRSFLHSFRPDSYHQINLQCPKCEREFEMRIDLPGMPWKNMARNLSLF